MPLIKHPSSLLRSVRGRVALLCGLGGLVFGLLLTTLIEWKIEASALATADKNRRVTAGHVATRILEDLRHRTTEVEFTASVTDAMEGMTVPQRRAMLDRIREGRPQYAWVGMTDARGVVVAATGGLLEGRDVSQRPWFEGARDGLYIGDIHEARLLSSQLPPNPDGSPVRFVDIAVPMKNPDGQWRGVMAAHLHAYWIREAVSEAIREMKHLGGLEIFVSNRTGELLYKPEAVAVARVDELRQDAAHYVSTVPVPLAELDGVDLGWLVTVRETRASIEAPILDARNQMFGLSLVASLLFIWVSWLVAGRATRTTRQLAEDALNYHADTGLPFETSVAGSEDEVAVLAEVIRNLVDRMRLHADRLALFIEHAPVPLAIFDTGMRYLAVSERWLSDYGLAGQDLVGRCHYDIFPEIPEHWRAIHRRAMAGEVLSESTDRFTRSDGRAQWLHWIVRPWHLPDGAVGGVAIFTEDVTASVLAEAALKDSEARFRATFEQAAVGIAHVALDGSWLRVNDKLSQIVGYSPDVLLSKTFQDITYAEDLETDLDNVHRLLAGEIEQYQMEKRYIRATGELVWINLTVSLVRRADGAPDYFVSVIEDIHARKLTELAVLEQGQMLSDMSAMAAVGGWSMDPVTREGSWTPECARIHDLPADSPLDPDRWCRGFEDNYQQMMDEAFETACRDGVTYDMVAPMVTWRGVGKWVRVMAHPWIENGTVRRVFGACQDVTSQRAAAQAMESYQMRLEAEVESQTRALVVRTEELTQARNYFREFVLRAPMPLCIVHTDGRIALRNEQFVQSFGYDEAMVPTLEAWWRHAYPDPQYRAWALETWQRERELARTEKRAIGPVEYRVSCADGSERMMEVSGINLDSGFLCTFVDVTERRRAQREAEQANQAKSDFLATMSHEIRTPMNAIIGISQLLERSELPEESKARVGALRKAGKNLMALINHVLDLSKIESGHLEIDASPFSLVRMVENMMHIFTPTAADKGISLRLDAVPGDVDMLVGDAFRLEQVLYNLVGNALKFTALGEVRVGVSVLEANADWLRLRFAVHDSGIGIAPDKIDSLFKAFAQVDASTSRQYGGTGLGLAICRQLVTLMGGQIGVNSVPGEGSEFWFEIPFRRAAPDLPATSVRIAGIEPAAGLRLNGIRILVADDSEVNLDVARHLLELEGALCETVSGGREALDCLRQRADSFDLVLMDIEMPDMDGLSATRMVREALGLRDLPVVALTAGALTSQRDKAMEAQMTDFMVKPFELDDLVAVVLRYCQPRQSDAATRRVWPLRSPDDGGFPAVPGLDIEQASRIMLGNADMFYRALRILRDEFGDASAQIRRQLAAGDPHAASMLLHKLRGSAGNLGALQIVASAADIEHCLKHGNPVPELLIDELAQTLERVLGGLPGDIDVRGLALRDDSAIECEEIQALAHALDNNSMNAFDLFASLRARLAFHQPERCHELEAAVEDFEFKEASTILKAFYPHG